MGPNCYARFSCNANKSRARDLRLASSRDRRSRPQHRSMARAPSRSFRLTVVGAISFTDLEDIQTAGRLVQMGEDKWVKVREIKEWDSPPEKLQD